MGSRQAAASALAFLILPLALPGQVEPKDTRIREEARVTLVEVPVNVIDKDGRPVENLKAEDFEVYDDGKSLPITGFEVLDQRRPVSAGALGEVPINASFSSSSTSPSAHRGASSTRGKPPVTSSSIA